MAGVYSSILVPIEFDDPSMIALGFAKQLAVDNEATLHLLHVASVLPAFGDPAVSEKAHSPVEEKARATLEIIAKQHLTGVAHQIHTASAGPRALAKAIVVVAAEVNADIIVIKTHGRKGLSRFILGSVAEEVVRTALCPVLTLSPDALTKLARVSEAQGFAQQRHA
jgi:nucleotide-binding universal stress UspA family protein